MEAEMKRQFLMLAAFTFILASGMGLAQGQQATGDRPIPQRDQQGQGMMTPGMGMTPDMMQMMQRRMSEQQGRMGMGPGMMGHGGMLRIMFAIMDADGDRTLALGEVQDVHARIFKHIDADKNSRVTMEEIQAFFRGTGPAANSDQ